MVSFGPAPALGLLPGSSPELAHGLPADIYLFHFLELFAQVAVIEGRIDPQGQINHLFPDLLGQGVGRRPPPVAMDQALGSLSKQLGLEPLGLPVDYFHEDRCLLEVDPILPHHLEHMVTSPFLLTHAYYVSHKGDILALQLKGT